MVAIQCAEARSYDHTGHRLSRPYRVTCDQWTEVENAQDLEYLLNHQGVVFRERPELGYRYYRALGDEEVHIPGERRRRLFRQAEVVAADGVLSRVLGPHSGFAQVPVVDVLQEVPNLRVLVVRNGGLGDVLLTLPAVARLREEFPNAGVCYSTSPGLKRLVEHQPVVDKAYTCFEAYDNGPFGYVLDLGYWAERAQANERYHRSDIFAHAFGYPDAMGYSFGYRVLDHERQWARAQLGDRPTVAVQVSGSINRRCPPRPWQEELLRRLKTLGHQVLVFGEKREQWGAEMNFTGQPPVWQVAALVEQACGVVAGDSGILHIGNALNRPTVGLYGPVDPALRVREHPLCRTVSGNEVVGCPPCNDHQLHQCEGIPECLKCIDHDEVMGRLFEVMALDGLQGK